MSHPRTALGPHRIAAIFSVLICGCASSPTWQTARGGQDAPPEVPSARQGATGAHPVEVETNQVNESETTDREVKPYRGTFSVLFENDIFVGNDSRFTAGAGLAWTSAELESYSEGNFHRKFGDTFSFLPLVGKDGYERFLQWNLRMEMYTPRDIEASEPPPGDHPYAGLLLLDSSIFARSEVSLHQYTLRAGLVGPSSGAEQVQRLIHEVTGSTIPAGWDTQLHDEPILNGFYQYHRRLYDCDLPGSLGTDLAVDGGVGLGNFYTGGNAGATLRLGFELPNTYAATPMLGGLEPLVGLSPSDRWCGYLCFSIQGFGVARFLPTDGNTFRESRSGERDDWFATTSLGLMIGYGRFLVSYTYNGISGLTNPGGVRTNSQDDYATIVFSYLF